MAKPDCTAVPAALPFVFRNLRHTDPPPAVGELHIIPANEGDRCLARLVLDRGPEALPSGAGPVALIVIKADPTLDDMLAGTIAAVQLAGAPVPAGMRPFVEYAAVLRQGLSPGTAVPLERSLAGLYKAIRWKHGDLTDRVRGRRFAEDWRRLAATIFAYAGDGLDPFSEFPLPSWLFADDQRFLAGDRDLYLRDKAAGETWSITIPDEGPAAQRRSALLLRRPQSRLWKEWARSDPAARRRRSVLATSGKDAALGYDFIAVDEEGTGNWVFSTNPVDRVPIRSLRDRLQKEEATRAVDRTANDPWVSLFDDTLVAAPTAGTAIPEADLLRLVKSWAGARPTRRRTLTRGVPVALGCIVLVALLGARWAGAAPLPEPVLVTVVQEGKPTQYVRLSPNQEGDHFAKVDVNIEPGAHFDASFPVRKRAPQPVLLKVAVTLPDGGAPLANPIGLTVNGRLLAEAVPADGGSNQSTIESKSAYLRAGENIVGVLLVNDRPEELRAQIQVSWENDPNYRPDLYVLAIGTSKYRRHDELPLSEPDAEALVGALRAQGGPGRMFGRVVAVPADGKPLLHPTREQLLDAVGTLKRKAPEGAVAWVFISGHGEMTADDQFCLVLAGANGIDEQLTWGQVYAAIDGLRCPVVVLLDTCCSGGIQSDIATVSRLAFGKQSPSGRVLISATFGRERTYESDEWGHSALVLATLECLTGKSIFKKADAQSALDQGVRILAGRRVVTLEDFCRYVTDRVAKLYELRGDSTGARPGVSQTPALNMTRIPVAVRP